jgi:hypothetical protein
MTRVKIPATPHLERRLLLLEAAGLLGLTGCLEVAPESLESTPSPITQFRIVSQLARDGERSVSFGGYLNGQSFQQDGVLTYEGYQYAAFWNEPAQVVLARRPAGDGTWQYAVIAPDYVGLSGDSHRTISMGVSPADGRLHVAFGHYASDLNYVSSVAGLMTSPGSMPWRTESFGALTNQLGPQLVDQVTYPRFLTAPNGKMLFSYRKGLAGGSDEVLWEYDGATATWTRIGTYIAGVAAGTRPYLHSLEFSGQRLHAAWCWRTTPHAAASNHDLLYAFSDDLGRTWLNNHLERVGTADASPITPNSKVQVWGIGPNRGLMHQEHMIVDHAGGAHVLLSHLPDTQPDESDFDQARKKSEFFHYWRNDRGAWTRQPMHIPVQGVWRGKLAVSSSNNLYAVLPNIRIATASASANWANWRLVDVERNGIYFSDPLIDRQQLRQHDRLTVFTPTVPIGGVVYIDTIGYTLY